MPFISALNVPTLINIPKIKKIITIITPDFVIVKDKANKDVPKHTACNVIILSKIVDFLALAAVSDY